MNQECRFNANCNDIVYRYSETVSCEISLTNYEQMFQSQVFKISLISFVWLSAESEVDDLKTFI